MLTSSVNEIAMYTNQIQTNCFVPIKLNTAFEVNPHFAFKNVQQPFKSFDQYSKNSIFAGQKPQSSAKMNSNIVFPKPMIAESKPVDKKEIKKSKNSALMTKFMALKTKNSETIHEVRELEEDLSSNFDKMLNIYDTVVKQKKIKKEKRKLNKATTN